MAPLLAVDKHLSTYWATDDRDFAYASSDLLQGLFEDGSVAANPVLIATLERFNEMSLRLETIVERGLDQSKLRGSPGRPC
jgi:hypothetical protein